MLGNAAANAGLPDEATDHLAKALDMAELTGDRLVQAHTHQTLAWILEQQKHHQRAMEHIIRALDLLRSLNEPVWEAPGAGERRAGTSASHGLRQRA